MAVAGPCDVRMAGYAGLTSMVTQVTTATGGCSLTAIGTVIATSQAQGTITDAGLTVGAIALSGNCSFPPGTVIRQSPAAGTTASRGSAVNLTEATPPRPHGCAQ